jgi:hypothetical protein
MSVVAQRYGYSVQYEVVNDRVGQAFADAASEAKLRVAGCPRITQKDDAPEGQLAFDATFEVYPEVKLGDLSAVEVERVSHRVSPRPPSTARSRSCASSAAASPSARPPKACRDRPRDHRLRGQDRRRALRRRQGRGLPVHHRRRPDARAVRQGRARHEGRREQDLPAAVPGRLPRQGRGRQGSRLPGHGEEDRGAAPAEVDEALPSRWASRTAPSRPARRREEEPGARGQVPRAGAQQGRRDGRAGQGGRARPAQGRWSPARPSAWSKPPAPT